MIVASGLSRDICDIICAHVFKSKTGGSLSKAVICFFSPLRFRLAPPRPASHSAGTEWGKLGLPPEHVVLVRSICPLLLRRERQQQQP